MAGILVALPPLVAAVAALAQGWVPQGDHALEVLRVAEVGTRHTPLVGAWSRWGWDHPGPLLFWVSAPAYRLAGPAGVAATVGLVNAAAATAAVAAARRLGGAALAWPAAAVALLVELSMGDELVDPWNPYVGILPLLAFLACAWAGARGDRALLAVAVVAGSYCVQAHLGFLPVVAVGGGLAAAWAVTGWRRRRTPPPVRFVAGLGALALALWSGPIVEQLAAAEGNAGRLWAYIRRPPEPAIGWDLALHLAGRQFGVPAPWMGATDITAWGFPRGASPLGAAGVAAAAALAGVLAWRRRDGVAAAFVAYVLVLVVASVGAISRITGITAPYLLRWAWPVAALVWAAAAGALLRRAGPRGQRRAVAALAAASVGLAAVAIGAAATVSLPTGADEAAVAALGQRVRSRLDDDAAYRFTYVDAGRWGAVGTGVAVDLQRRGWDVRVTEPLGNAFGEWRTARPGDAGRPMIVVRAHVDRLTWTPPAGARLVAAWDPLTPAERREATRLERRIRVGLAGAAPAVLALSSGFARSATVAQGADEAAVARLAELQERGDAYEVWLVAAP